MGTANLFSVFVYVYSYLINGFYKLSTSILALADIFTMFQNLLRPIVQQSRGTRSLRLFPALFKHLGK